MFGNRIQRARKALGLSLRDLGEQITLSHAAIKKYEDNEVIPSSDILIKLAEALHVKVEYFFRPDRFKLENIHYRKHDYMPERQLQEITASILDHLERRIELENLFPTAPTQTFSIKSLSAKITRSEDIEKIAEHMRTQWNLGLGPLPDLLDVFEMHGIKILIINNELYPKIDGLYAEINGMPIIVVGNQRPGDRQRFTLAHELGHILLNKGRPAHMDIEQCCNRFAGAFLLPKQSLIKILGEYRNSIEARELNLIKQEYGISMTSILHRAEDVGIISNNLHRELRAEFNKKGWSKNEPGKQYPKEKQHIFEQMIFHALAEGYIGEAKAAELMNMTIKSFRSWREMENHDIAHHQ